MSPRPADFPCLLPLVRRWLFPVYLALATGCSPDGSPSPADRAAARHAIADLVLFNGRILTMDARMPQAVAIAVRDGRIVALGDSADIEPLTNMATRLIDLEGRVVLPGLLDARDPDAGAPLPPCIDPALGEAAATPSTGQSPADTVPDAAPVVPAGAEAGLASEVSDVITRMQRRGLTAMRFRSAPVSALPGLLQLSHEGRLQMQVQMGHIPPCGAAERLQLQQVMRDMLAGGGGTAGTSAAAVMLRLRLDPTPAVPQPPAIAPGTLVSDPAVLPQSDPPPAPASPALVALTDPWAAIAAMVQGSASGPGQSARKALGAFTTGAAKAFGLQHEAGMLAPGMRADMAVIDRNPLESTPEAIAATEVLQTWFGGELVYGQADFARQ